MPKRSDAPTVHAMPGRVRCLDTQHRWSFDRDGNLIRVEAADRQHRVVVDHQGNLHLNPTQRQLRTLLRDGAVLEYVHPVGTGSRAALRNTQRVWSMQEDGATYGMYQHLLPPELWTRRDRIDRQLEAARDGGRLYGSKVQLTGWPQVQRSSWLIGASDIEALQLIELHRSIMTAFPYATELGLTPAEARFVLSNRNPALQAMMARSIGRTFWNSQTPGQQQVREPLRQMAAFASAAPPGADPLLLHVAFDDGVNPDELRGMTRQQLGAYMVFRTRGLGVDDTLDLLANTPARQLKALALELPAELAPSELFDAAVQRGVLTDWLCVTLGAHPDRIPTLSLGHLTFQQLNGIPPTVWAQVCEWDFRSATGNGTPGMQPPQAELLIRASCVFGKRIGEWQRKAERAGLSFHDAMFWVPDDPVFAEWALAVAGRSGDLKADLDALRAVGPSWPGVDPAVLWSPSGQPISAQALRDRLRVSEFGLLSGTPLAELGVRHGISASRLAAAAGVWASSVGEVSWLPTTGRRVGGLTWEFLPRHAAETLFIGEETDCCQSVGSVGEPCAVYSQTMPSSGLLAIRDRRGKITAQAWVWLSEDGVAVFDNVERLSSGADAGRAADVRAAVLDAADALVAHGTSRVQLGLAMTKIDTAGFERADAVAPWQYTSYRDSHTQALIRSGTPPVTVRPAVLDDRQQGLVVTCAGARMTVHRHTDRRVLQAQLTVDGATLWTRQDVRELAQWMARTGQPAHVESGSGDHARANAALLREALTAEGVSDKPADLSHHLGAMTTLVGNGGDSTALTDIVRTSLQVSDADRRDWWDDEEDWNDQYRYDSYYDDFMPWESMTPQTFEAALGRDVERFDDSTDRQLLDRHGEAWMTSARRYRVPAWLADVLDDDERVAMLAAVSAGVEPLQAALCVRAGVTDVDDILWVRSATTDLRAMHAWLSNGRGRYQRPLTAEDRAELRVWGEIASTRPGWEDLRWRQQTEVPMPAINPGQAAELMDGWMPGSRSTASAAARAARAPQPPTESQRARTEPTGPSEPTVERATSEAFEPVWDAAPTLVERFDGDNVAAAVAAGLASSDTWTVGTLVEAVSYLDPANAYVRTGAAAGLRELLTEWEQLEPVEREQRWQEIDPFPHAAGIATVMRRLFGRQHELRTAQQSWTAARRPQTGLRREGRQLAR